MREQVICQEVFLKFKNSCINGKVKIKEISWYNLCYKQLYSFKYVFTLF